MGAVFIFTFWKDIILVSSKKRMYLKTADMIRWIWIINTLLLMFCLELEAQTTFWTESFSSGSAARGTLADGYPSDMIGSWALTNLGTQGDSANQWYVSGEECGTPAGLCGSACPNANASLHVSAIGGLCGTPDCGAAYNATNTNNVITNRRIESPLIDCGNYQNVSLSFDYIAAQGDSPNDQVKVVYSCNGGTSWQDLPGGSPLTASSCCLCSDPFLCLFTGLCCGGVGTCTGLDQGQWTNINIPLPACVNNNPNFRFGFVWQNDGNGVGTDPSFAVDDIEVRYDFFLPEVALNFSGEVWGNHIRLQAHSRDWYRGDRFTVAKETENGETSFLTEQETTSEPFELLDRKPMIGLNRYKLSLLDEEGQSLGHQWIEIGFDGSESFSIKLAPQPLPSGELLQVIFSSPVSTPFMYQVFDIKGREIINHNFVPATSISQMTIPTQNASSGMYFLRITSLEGDFSFAERFVLR